MKKVITVLSVSMLLCPAFAQKTLKGAYADAFKMGCAVNSQIVSGRDSRSAQIILEQFNAISPENDMKAEVLHPRPDTWNFQAADRYVQFARDNGLWALGHTLVWHNQTPDFFFNHDDGTPKSHDEMVETMRSYIEKVAGHFAGKINAGPLTVTATRWCAWHSSLPTSMIPMQNSITMISMFGALQSVTG